MQIQELNQFSIYQDSGITLAANSRQSEAQIININNGNQNIGQISACIDFSNL